jgi:hypothetical protein
LHRRAKAFGFVLQHMVPTPDVVVSLRIVVQRRLADLGMERLHVDGGRGQRHAPDVETWNF